MICRNIWHIVRRNFNMKCQILRHNIACLHARIKTFKKQNVGQTKHIHCMMRKKNIMHIHTHYVSLYYSTIITVCICMYLYVRMWSYVCMVEVLSPMSLVMPSHALLKTDSTATSDRCRASATPEDPPNLLRWILGGEVGWWPLANIAN
jgi:hypothetical protein